jgi:formylglycine-generating enzyme required for sulfatase activity
MTVVAGTRAELAKELDESRRRTEELFATLRPEYLYERPIAERHRIIFYVGHLEAFDYIQICREGLGRKSTEPSLDSLFQAGIDPDSDHLPSDTPRDWPSPEQVAKYAAQARAAVDAALEAAPEEAVWMALEHRLMHLETLAYMWHNFSYEKKVGPSELSANGRSPSDTRLNEWCEIPAGDAVLGKPRDGLFGWDNEYDEHTVFVPAFRVQRYKVTNGEYLAFVRAGARLPHFWSERSGKLHYRGMFGEIPLPLNWPVYVTLREAEAYAKWLGKRLPTEAEYHRAAFATPDKTTRPFPWGEASPNHTNGNFDFKRWDPEPVHAAPDSESAFGVEQLVGNGWEWTQTVFSPFDGFKPSPSYLGYSANFFDGQHYVLKGASPRTAGRLLRRSFRNWFRPEYSYVYAGFRCVDD